MHKLSISDKGKYEMNNHFNKEQVYAIEFLGMDDEPLPYCYLEIVINGYPLSASPLQADGNGRWTFQSSLVEQAGEEPMIKVTFWNDRYPKTEHSEVPEFTWIKGKKVVRLRTYNIYEITPRTILNENNEKATYKRPYHVVKSGDTWESIEKEAGANRYALMWENGLDEATPLETLVGKKIYFPKGTRKNKTQSKQAQGDISSPKQPSKSEDKKVSKSAEKKKANQEVIQERSANNGKPVDVVVGENKKRFDWFETPLVKLIVSKESRGSFNAYNITGWDAKGRNRIYESHFEPTKEYHLEKMTIAEIRKAQTTEIGPNREHLFAVGIFQMTPRTLFGKLPSDKSFMKWINNYRQIDESKQLFNKDFQQLTPLYFWEEKRPKIAQYFQGNETVINAAYEVAQEWASAAVPEGLEIMKKKGQDKGKISDGKISFYDSDGLNKAHYSADKTIEALEATKKMIYAAGGYDSVRNDTLSILSK